MKVFLTGVTGFAGPAVSEKLFSAGMDLTVLSRKEPQIRHHRWIKGDLRDQNEWAKQLAGHDAIVHMAAFNPPRFSQASRNKAEMDLINCGATLELARMGLHFGVRHFIFISSVRVYGSGGDQPFNEEMSPEPGDPYGQSKWAAETGLHNLMKDRACALTILRPPVVVGPARGGWFGLAATLGRKGWLLPSRLGLARKSIIHRNDLASAIAAALACGERIEGTFNVAGQGTVILDEMARMSAGKTGSTRDLRRIPKILLSILRIAPRIGETIAHAEKPCIVDTTRFQAASGWTASVTHHESLESMVGSLIAKDHA